MQELGEWVREEMLEYWMTAQCFCPNCQTVITLHGARTDVSEPLPDGPIHIDVCCPRCDFEFRAITHRRDV